MKPTRAGTNPQDMTGIWRYPRTRTSATVLVLHFRTTGLNNLSAIPENLHEIPVHHLRRWPNVSCSLPEQETVACAYASAQETHDVEPILVSCWPTVSDGGPTLNQDWFNTVCLLGEITGL